MKDLEKVFSRGLLANVFRISRLAGVAPYTYTRNGPVISKSLTIYGYCIVTFISEFPKIISLLSMFFHYSKYNERNFMCALVI